MPSPSPKAARTHKPPEQRRQEILDAAMLVFAECGYRCADVDRIAEKAGVGKGTVYRIFCNKEAVFLASVEQAIEGLRSYVLAGIESLEDPREVIRRIVHCYFEYFDHNPTVVELFVQERAEFRNQSKPLYFVYQETEREKWLAFYQQLQASGLMRDVDPAVVMDLVGNLLLGTVFSQRLAGDRQPLVEQVDGVVDLLFHGFLRSTP